MKIVKEAGLIIQKNTQAYPTNGQILIMAGGAGSGKGYVLNNVLLFDGKVFNVDDLKIKLVKLSKNKPNCKFNTLFKSRFGYELKNLNFKDGQQVKDLHYFINSLGIPESEKMAFFASTKLLHEKPNVIFDVTLDNPQKLKDISYYASLGGYDPKNINIVWVLTDIKVAKNQNAMRSRSVPEDLLVATHEGAAMTMFELMANAEKYSQFANGDFWIIFNTANIDSRVKQTRSSGLTGKENKSILHVDPKVIDGRRGYLALHLKERGQRCKHFADIDIAFRRKILQYVPKP